MMQGVAIAWQIYALTDDPMDLGLVGLVQFFPVVLLSLVIGQVADRFDRRAIAAVCQVAKAIAALALALGTASGWLTRDSMLALLLLSGTARAFELPTMHALIPGLVPRCCCHARSRPRQVRNRPRSSADPPWAACCMAWGPLPCMRSVPLCSSRRAF